MLCQKGSAQLNTFWGQLWAKMDFYRKWQLQASPFIFLSHLFKNNIYSPWVGIGPFWSGSSIFVYEETLCFLASLWAWNTQRRPSAHNRCPCWSEYSLCAHGFLMLLYRCGPIWSARILVSCYFVPFSKGPYFRQNMYKIGIFFSNMGGGGGLDIFRTRNFIEGKVFCMRTRGYFTEPVLII